MNLNPVSQCPYEPRFTEITAVSFLGNVSSNTSG